jgi:hypothetical protein
MRGNFNAGVDRAFQDVCVPPPQLFPHLGALKDFECDEDVVGAVWLPPSPAAPPPLSSTPPARPTPSTSPSDAHAPDGAVK